MIADRSSRAFDRGFVRISTLKYAVPALAALVVSAANAQMAIPGSFTTNPNGAAIYSIPIQVPPGVAGLQPELTLTYNSQARNGLMGVGWNLNGLSSIERCPQTHFQDNQRSGVSYSSTDRFCLNGQRLMLVTGTYGAAGSTYATEMESFAKITLKGAVNGGPDWFLVQSASGQLLEFGNSPDSKIQVTDATTAGTTTTKPYRSWALNKISDAVGNYLSVTYSKDAPAGVFNGGYYPQTIAYGGNAALGLAASSTVTFDFDVGSRSDNLQAYQGGYPITRRGRLKSVTTNTAGADVLTYGMTYESSPGTGRSRLKTISMCKPGGACLVPTTISYPAGATTTPLSQLAQTGIATDNQSKWNDYTWLVMDVDGDGRNDLVFFPPGAGNGAGIFISAGDGTFRTETSFTNPMPMQNNISNPGTVKIATDENGDGLPDIVFLPPIGTGGVQYSWISLGGARPSPISGQPINFYESVPDPAQAPLPSVSAVDLTSNDFDSDGIADITGTSFNTDYLYRFDQSTAAFRPAGGSVSDTAVTWVGGSISIDLDGDGQLDRFYPMRTDDGRVREWLLPYYNASTAPSVRYAGIDQGTDKDLRLSTGGPWLRADVNGDGLVDLIHVNTVVKEVYVWISKGNGDFTVVPNSSTLDNTDFTKGTWQVVDYNGDGFADLIHTDGTAGAKLWTSNGLGHLTVSTLSNTADSCPTSCPKWLAVGMRGDGVVDLIHFLDSGSRYEIWNMPRVFVDTPSGIDVGVGNVYRWQSDFVANLQGKPLGTTTGSYTAYDPGVDPAAFDSNYVPSFPTKNHLAKVLTPVSVVVRVDMPDGFGSSKSVSYDYGPMMADLGYHGFAGFQWTQETDQSSGLSSRTTRSQSFPYTGMPIKIERGTSAASFNNLSTTVNTLACLHASSMASVGVATTCSTNYPTDYYGWRYFPVVTQSTTTAQDFDGVNFWALPGVRQTVAVADIDQFGNRLKSLSTVLNPDGTDSLYTTQTTNTYYNDTTNWRLGRLLTSAVRATGPSLPASVVPGSGGLPPAPAPKLPPQIIGSLNAILSMLLAD